MDYFSPSTMEEALERIAAENVTIVAGGTDYYPSRPKGPLKTHLLDVTGILEMRGITRTDTGWRFGAATRWSDITRADLPPAFAGLQAAAREVGSLQIQNAGTVGGNLCNASPAADGVPPLLTLDAEVELRSGQSTRTLPLEDFITGVRQTALRHDELLTAVLMPDPPGNAVGAFEKLGTRRYLVISIAMTAAVIGFDGSGRISHARIAVGSCSPVARRLHGLETGLLGKTAEEVKVTGEHLSGLSPIDDVRGSADYRNEAAVQQVLQSIRNAVTAHG